MRRMHIQVVVLMELLLGTVCFVPGALAQDFNAAQTFQARCAGCHTIGGGALVGPDLKDVTKRRDEAWIIKFVQNSTVVIQSGDPYAVALFKQFNNIPMPPHEFTDDQVRALIKHIETGGAPQAKTGLPEVPDPGRWTWSLIEDNRGYQPEQPIAFSHKRHAGDNNIPCLYCHFGAEKSRHAGIPPVNVCMNCHKFIMKDSPEVAKIYQAVDAGRSIEWVKVHKMPDFVYFNHAQHVAVGNIQCQKCHGEVQTMVRLRQEAPVTMGWCVNCHRSSDVPGHSRDAAGRIKPVKLSERGGLDCSKCHI